MKQILLVAAGGALGSVARYLTSGLVQRATASTFPTGTFAVNLAGSFLVGLIAGVALERWTSGVRLFLVMGFCGGFTTFSAFSYETLELLRGGELARAGFNVAGQVLAGLAAVWAGFVVAKMI